MSAADRHIAGNIRLAPNLDREVRKIADMTRRPISQVLNDLVSYALEHAEVKPVQLYDIHFKKGR